jgi:hypothetical protein
MLFNNKKLKSTIFVLAFVVSCLGLSTTARADTKEFLLNCPDGDYDLVLQGDKKKPYVTCLIDPNNDGRYDEEDDEVAPSKVQNPDENTNTVKVTCPGATIPSENRDGGILEYSCNGADTTVKITAASSTGGGGGGGGGSGSGSGPIITDLDPEGEHECGSGDRIIKTRINFGCKGEGNAVIDLLFAIIRFLSLGAGLVTIASIIVGGIQYSTAQDNPSTKAAAMKRIASSVGALILFFFIYAMLNWIIPGGIAG